MSDLSGRCVLVTGASTGIGEACAIELDRRGCRVFAGVRREADAQRLRGQASRRLVPLMLDVTDAQQIGAACSQLREVGGEHGLDGLVNNAGIAEGGPLELLPLESLRYQLEVNVVGQVAVTQAMISLLRQARGRIVNIGSVNGRLAAPFMAPYAASKFAMEALTDALRLELRTWGIFVCIVEPASVKTPIWDKAIATADSVAQRTEPEQMALYQADFDAVQKAIARMAEIAMPVEWVVRAVMHGLWARRPKTRYPVGRGVRLLLGAMGVLPDRARDWRVRRAMGLK